MVLVSLIQVDTGSQTVTLTATVGGDSVETITFDNTTQQVTFAARSGILINFSEFLSFSDQVNIFETAILFNFSTINSAATKPFDKIVSNEFHDIGAGNWNLTVSPLSGDDVVSYEATKSSLKLYMNTRSSDVTLSFPEWILFLQSFNHYRLSVKAF
jgi:hypothetical protein